MTYRSSAMQARFFVSKVVRSMLYNKKVLKHIEHQLRKWDESNTNS